MTFILPVIFLTCFIYPVQTNEIFKGWLIEQPFILLADGVYNVKIADLYVVSSYNHCKSNAKFGNLNIQFNEVDKTK